MWAVEENDLRLLIRTAKQLSVWLVPIKHRGQRWYQMEFEVGDLEERGLLISARKNPRRWKSLNKAIEFVEVTFPVTELRVTTSPQSGKAKAAGGRTSAGRKTND
jgi:hypothetical protein